MSDHKPGEAPAKGTRDSNGVQQFGSIAPKGPCPDGLEFDPLNGECVAPAPKGEAT